MHKFLLLVLFFISLGLNAQNYEDDAFYDAEGMMLDRFVMLTSDTANAIKDKASNEISSILAEYLKEPGSSVEDFELKNLGSVTSQDGKLTIFTWNYQHNTFRYKYGGVVTYKSSPNATPKVFELKHSADQVPLNLVDQNQWYGCLYYRIIETEYKGQKVYTVFGWDGYNSMVSRKMIDVITVRNDKVILGKPLFYMDKGRMNRMLFQYNARSVMMLDYEEQIQRIIFDHLSPSRPEDKGDYRTYGPDSTYDGLQFKKGKWYLEKDIDLRMGKDESRRKPKKIKPPRKQKLH